MACFDISFFHDLPPSWLKSFVAIPSNQDRTYTSPSRNTSLLEKRSRSLATYKSPANSSTDYGYVPGIIELPSPPSAYLSTISKPDMYGYQGCEPRSFNPTPPIPKEKPTSCDNNMKRFLALQWPSIFFPSISDIHAGQPMEGSSLYIIIINTFFKV